MGEDRCVDDEGRYFSTRHPGRGLPGSIWYHRFVPILSLIPIVLTRNIGGGKEEFEALFEDDEYLTEDDYDLSLSSGITQR
jgi:hypothetical protein